jgi:MSHA biogenesis protein MshK
MAADLMLGRQLPGGRKLQTGAATPQLLGFAVFCSLLPALCLAEELPDPTRPPAEVAAPQEQASAHKESGLQSVIISPTRRAAIINGHTVVLGSKVGDAKLVEISESSVVLQGPQGRRVLALFPEVGLKQKPPATTPDSIDVKRAAKKPLPARKADEPAAPKEGK